MPQESTQYSCWQLIDPSSLLLEEFDENTLCYNRQAAETHMLNAFPAELLKLIIAKPGATEDLALRLATLLDINCDDTWQETVQRVLNDLQHIHLIEARKL